MLNYLDNMLRHLFLANIPALTADSQVRFDPPDGDWRQYVSNLTVNNNLVPALNVYLVEIRENRKLRSNERTRVFFNGSATDTPAPRRVDCHYLITAWSPATPSAAIEPTIDELVLLYDACAVLMEFQPLVPLEVYAPDPLPMGFPGVLATEEIPTMVAPGEGFPKYAEFWGTMGEKHPWKPAVWLLVTVPVALRNEFAGALVTTRISRYVRADGVGGADVWIQIGGTVLDGGGQPLPQSWVGLHTTTDLPLQEATTGDDGRFTFASLATGTYRLRARAVAHGETTRDVEVPSPSGEYDLKFP